MLDNENIYCIISINAVEEPKQNSSSSEGKELVNEIGLRKLDFRDLDNHDLVNII